MIKELSKLDEVINYQSGCIIRKLNQKQRKIYNLIDKYLDEYAKFHKMNVKQILNCHKSFMKRYIKDLTEFEKSFKYPYQKKNHNPKIDRVTYDIALIMSCLLLSHRFEIMYNVSNLKNYGKKTFLHHLIYKFSYYFKNLRIFFIFAKVLLSILLILIFFLVMFSISLINLITINESNRPLSIKLTCFLFRKGLILGLTFNNIFIIFFSSNFII